MKILLALAASALVWADGAGVIESRHAATDFALTADPSAASWKGVPGVFATNGPQGQPVPGHRTEIRSRWTDGNLYFLFVCPYEQLHLKPDPVTTAETNQLWNWDVAEVFIGTDFEHTGRYKEFEVSPRGEWVDLDIDRTQRKSEPSWLWNSGFESKARIDEGNKTWYVEMRIPMASIGAVKPSAGQEMRVNLYRCQGADPGRKYIAWQPTGSPSFHHPEAFGRLKLVGERGR